MFNRRKANDPKYVAKKIARDVNNIRHIGLEGAKELFGRDSYRLDSLEFAEKVYKDPEIIKVIETLPMPIRRVVAQGVVTWHGDLITRFSDEVKNDPLVGTAAIGPDHVRVMPVKMVERVVNRDGDTEMREEIQYDQLKTWYDLFPLLGPDARDKIIRNGLFVGLKKEDGHYISENVPESFLSDVKGIKEVIHRRPFIYPALPVELKCDPEIIIKMLDTDYSKEAGKALETLSEEDKMKVLSDYRIGWYSHAIPDGLDFAFSDKKYLAKLLEKNDFDSRVLDKMDKELLKDPEFAKLCLSKMRAGYGNREQDFYDAFPQGTFDNAENVIAFVKGVDYKYKDSKVVAKMISELSKEEYAKAARKHPYIIGVVATPESAAIIEELITKAEDKDLAQLVHAVGGFESLSPEMKEAVFIKAPGRYYDDVKKYGREFFVEAALKNPDIIDYIKDRELKNDVLVEYTTIKYLERRAIKITTEEELDNLITKVMGAKKTTSKPKKTVKKEATTTKKPKTPKK